MGARMFESIGAAMVQERQLIDAATFDQWVAEQPAERLYEFINGELTEKPMVTSARHGIAVTALNSYLVYHLIVHDIDGYLTGETTGYRIGDHRYIPDGALVLGQPVGDILYSPNQPTLIIEMISSHPRRSVLDDKREIYLKANAVYWEGNMQKRYVDVYTPDGAYRRVRDTLTLDALPGLAIPLNKVFRG
jgi:Uma2 family endonuclease